MRLINVDFDGVLVPNTHEISLANKVKEDGMSFDDISSVWDWYDKLVNLNPLPINITLMNYLAHKKDEGHVIHLWTNRSYTLKTATKRNLGEWVGIFDDMRFYAGHKHTSIVEGIVIDNDYKNLTCGQVGIHYEWR